MTMVMGIPTSEALNMAMNAMSCWLCHKIGVRDLVARGYFIPGRTSQRGGGQAPMFPCRTLSDTVRGQALMG